MFAIHVEAPDFKGLNTVKQHKLINEVINYAIHTSCAVTTAPYLKGLKLKLQMSRIISGSERRNQGYAWNSHYDRSNEILEPEFY